MSHVDSTTAVFELHDHLLDSLSALIQQDADPIYETGYAVLSLLSQRPNAVRDLAYKKLNVYPFKDVPLCWRRAYEEACLWELLKRLESAIGPQKSVKDHRLASPETVERTAAEKHDDLSVLETWVDDAVELCDRAIIFTGAPGRRQLINTVLDWISERLCPDIRVCARDDELREVIDTERPIKRRRFSDVGQKSNGCTASIPPRFGRGRCAAPLVKPERAIATLKCPSVSQFEAYMRDKATPLIITDAIDHWLARARWPNPTYWTARTHGGRRLVPVELGQSYTDDGWGQKIVPFREFMQTYLLDRDGRQGRDAAAHNTIKSTANDRLDRSSSDDDDDDDSNKTPPIGYLAQHDLLSQIPALRNDIAIPDYCYADTPETAAANASTATKPTSDNDSDSDSPNHTPPAEPLLNIWLGPANTVSPAHTDPHHNILAQVFGSKYVRLFAPAETPCMYPMCGSTSSGDDNDDADADADEDDSDASMHESHRPAVDMGNTSQVDVGAFVTFPPTGGQSGGGDGEEEAENTKAQRRRFPRHATAAYVEAVLEAGECLYIPRGWWHYVRSLEPSCSVSFWWD